MPRARTLTLLPALALCVAAGCASHPSSGAERATPVTGVTTVTAKHLAFTPAAIQVPAGTTVTWAFRDGNVPHNVTFHDFRSPQVVTNRSWAHTFAQAGRFAYKCTLHSGMIGTVVVVPR